MSDQLQEMQANIVAAVQQELSRFSREVDGAIKKIRGEVQEQERANADLAEHIRALTDVVERSQRANDQYQDDLQAALEQRLDEFVEKSKRRHDDLNDRLGRVVDEANVGIAAAVEAAARPVLKELKDRQGGLETRVDDLDDTIQLFDEQAAKMVEHINTVTVAIDDRLGQVTGEVLSNFDERESALIARIDEVSALAARQESELNNLVGNKVDAVEDRVNERLVGLESRVNDEIGQRVADIDAHVGHISASLDDSVTLLSDRIMKADQKFTEVEGEIAKLRHDMENVDSEAIDEMKEKIGSALGQAELVRIEVERFQASVTESLDKTAVRITELETTVQDQNMDVETAVQLERLEEVERAVLMLDPDQFVRHDELAGLTGGDSTPTQTPTPGFDREAGVPVLGGVDSSESFPTAPQFDDALQPPAGH